MKRKLTFIFLSLFVVTAMMKAQDEPAGVDLDRTNWTVTTQTDTGYGYVLDGWSASLGAFTTGMPEQMFDGDAGTYLSLVKPGKSYDSGNGSTPVPTQASGFYASFTIDLQSPQTFDYMKWHHRYGNNPAGGGNSYNYLRVYGVDIFGSDTGDEFDFTQINTDGIVWIPNSAGYSGSVSTADPNTYTIAIPQSTYRFLRVQIVKWSDNYIGGDYTDPNDPNNPMYTGNGFSSTSSGMTTQIGEFGLGKFSDSGIAKTALSEVIVPSLIDAGEAFTINLGSASSDATVNVYTISGVKVSEQKVSGSSATQVINTKGIYIVEVKKNAERCVSKVVVK